LGALLIFSAVAMAYFYPLTRERHARVRAMLERKKERALAKEAIQEPSS
jgi:Na+/melibiose symporter-like transporter